MSVLLIWDPACLAGRVAEESPAHLRGVNAKPGLTCGMKLFPETPGLYTEL